MFIIFNKSLQNFGIKKHYVLDWLLFLHKSQII